MRLVERYKYIFLIVLGFLSTTIIYANNISTIDSLQQSLSQQKTWKEKKAVLENLADLTYGSERFKYYHILFDSATKYHDQQCRIMSLRELGNTPIADSIISFIRIAERMYARDTSLRGTLLFLRNKLEVYHINNLSQEQLSQRMRELLNQYKSLDKEHTDIYIQLELLNNICAYLSYVQAEGDFFMSTMSYLKSLATKLPEQDQFLSSLVYIRVANVFRNRGLHKESIETDSLLLKNITNLQKFYQKENRVYRNYNINYVAIYTRMLSNFEALNRDEIESIYQKAKYYIKEAGSKNIATMRINQIEFYYNMGIQNYNLADKYLNLIMNAPTSSMEEGLKYKFYEYKIAILNRLPHSQQELMTTFTDYVNILKENMSIRDAAKLQEMQILYDVDSLRNQNDKLLVEQQTAALNAKQHMIIFYIITIILLFVLLIILVNMYIKKKIFSQHLQEEKIIMEETQKQLILAKEKAERSEKLKSAFLANMSHEIRTPLNAIVGFSNLISEAETNEEKVEYSKIIETNSDLLLKLINDILELSKLEAGYSNENTISQFDMSKAFDQIVTTMELRDRRPGVSLIADNPYKKCIIEVDKNSVLQILINFTTNAIKYTSHGSITMAFRIVDGGIRISVKDCGIGISEQDVPKVFARFEKLNSFVQGTGLGLAICKAIVDKYDGKIGVESKLNVGSTFWAWIPCKIVETI